jgi:anti-sigma factor RsiW
MRWSNDKAARFQALREQEARGELSPAERAALDALLAALDAKARELLRIAEEEERLLADARSTLERLRQRSAALAEDYLRVMGHELAPAR